MKIAFLFTCLVSMAPPETGNPPQEESRSMAPMVLHWVAPEAGGASPVLDPMRPAHFAVFGDSQMCAVSLARESSIYSEENTENREAKKPGFARVILEWWGGERDLRWLRREVVSVHDLSLIDLIWDVAAGDPGEVLLLLCGMRREDGVFSRRCYSLRKGESKLLRDLDDLGSWDNPPRFFQWQGNIGIFFRSEKWGGVPIRGADAGRACSAIRTLCGDYSYPATKVRYCRGRLWALGQREQDGRWQLVVGDTSLDAPRSEATVLYEWKGNPQWESDYDFIGVRDAVVANLGEPDPYMLFVRAAGEWEARPLPSLPIPSVGYSYAASSVLGGSGGEILVGRTLECRDESLPSARIMLEAFAYSEGRWRQMGSHLFSLPANGFVFEPVMSELGGRDLFISWKEDEATD